LATRHGINPKAIAKRKARTSVEDLRTGPKDPKPTVLTVEEEAIIVAFQRQHALLPWKTASTPRNQPFRI
jgi:hypothetical protein